jgi:hypothetical protein
MIDQLDGKARFAWRAVGLICEINLRTQGDLDAHR